MKTEVLGVCYDNVTMCEAIDAARALLQSDATGYVVTPNAEIAYEALHSEPLRTVLNHAQLVLPDGAGVVLASKLVRTPLKQKVAGFDFAMQLLPVLAELDLRLFLLGSKPGVAQEAAAILEAKDPGLCICGTADGYFAEDSEAVQAIRAARADVVFVCLGAPKQEFFMRRNLSASGARLMLGLGGTLDVVAGHVRRAPRWMQKLGLEWLYRLLRQPSRFGRMLRLPKYIFAALKKRWKG